MLYDFEFKDDGRVVQCTRGVREPAAGHTRDDGWWYLAVEADEPVRIRAVEPGETRQDVWESALHHLDAAE